MNQPVHLPVNWRAFWEENGSLIFGGVCLSAYLAMNLRDTGSLLNALSPFFLPLSAFYSAHTVLRIFDRHAPLVGWWLRGLVRWLSWWIVHALIVTVVLGMTEDQLFPRCPRSVSLLVLLGIPTLALARQILHDFAVARYEFGSIAKAGRATRTRTL